VKLEYAGTPWAYKPATPSLHSDPPYPNAVTFFPWFRLRFPFAQHLRDDTVVRPVLATVGPLEETSSHRGVDVSPTN
jgi:hypothetical protein